MTSITLICGWLSLLILSAGLVQAQESETQRRSEREIREVTLTLRNRFTPGEQTESITWTTLVPRSIPDRQAILELRYSREPDRTFERLGNRYAVFEMTDLQEPVVIEMEIKAELYRYDYQTLAAIPDEELRVERINTRLWLKHERFIETDSASIQAAADEIEGESREDRVQNTLRFLSQSLRYSGYREESLGASGGLEAGSGDCSEFSDLFVALCRAQEIPARTCDGILIATLRPGDTPRHKWAEVYFEGLGWVPVDPLRSARRSQSFRRMPNDCLFLSHLRNDASLNDYEIAFYRYVGDPIEFENEVILHD